MKKLLFLFALFIPLVCAQADDEPQYEDFPAGAGSQLYPMGCKRVDSNTAQTSTDGDLSLPVCDQYGQLKTSSSLSFTGGTADATKLEDAAHSSGDRGDFVLGIVNTSNTTLAADGDYVGFSTDTAGRLKIAAGSLTIGDVTVGAVTRNEDSAHTSTHAALNTLGLVRQDTAAGMAADGDYVFGAVDSANRQYVNPWGANHTEWFKACSGSDVTGTTATEVVAATASKYKYLTAVNCTNTDATVNTRVEIVENTSSPTTIWHLNLPAITGSDGFQFNPPIKSTSTNQNLGVTPITTSAEVRCCMVGFVSAN